MKLSAPKISANLRNFPSWLSSTLRGWRDYFVNLPSRAKSLTRRQIKTKIAKYLFSFVLVYFIVGVLLGMGFYLKKIPLGNSFGDFWASLYPYPAEIVGMKVVTLRDIAKQEQIIYYFANSTGSDLGNRLEVDQKVMTTIEEVRLAQIALDKYNIKISDKDVDAIMKQIEDENGGAKNVENLLESLYGIKVNEFKLVVRDQLAKDKIKSEALKTVKVRHILVDSEDKAKELRTKITKGEIKFVDAVKANSKDTEANKKDGLVTTSESSEYIGRDSGLAKEFVDAAMKTKKGKISAPVKTEFGWHLILVEDAKGSVDMSYEDWLKDAQKNTLIWRLYRP